MHSSPFGLGVYCLQRADAGPRTSDSGLPFGLTGGVACGKSTVAGYFQDLGAYVIDADRVGHELIEPGQSSYHDIVDHFGKDILDPEGRIDRKKLGPTVFADPQQRLRLNAILHPRIIAHMQKQANEEQRRNPHSLVIIDAPLIFESGMEKSLHKVVVVWCRPEQQLERLLARPGVSRQEAERRIQAQMPLEEKRRRADYVIDCAGSLEETRRQVERLFPELQTLAGQGSPSG